MSTPQIAPDLALALKTPSQGSPPLNVFVKLQIPEHAATPQERAEEVAKVVRRVVNNTRETPKFQFRDSDRVLHVKANKDFMRELVKQPEILEAKSVPSISSAMIEPTRKRDVDASAIDTRFDAPRRTTPRGR